MNKYVEVCVVYLVEPDYFEKVQKPQAGDEVCLTLVAFCKSG